MDIQVTGTDADGNEFPQDVEWTEDGAPVPTLSIVTSRRERTSTQQKWPAFIPCSTPWEAPCRPPSKCLRKARFARLGRTCQPQPWNSSRVSVFSFEPLMPLTTKFQFRVACRWK